MSIANPNRQGAYFSFDMLGWAELDQSLEEIQDIGTQKRVLVGAMKKALKPVLVTAKQKVPVDEGDLKSSLIISTSITKRQRRLAGLVRGVPRVFVGTNWPSAHLVEFGTAQRVAKIRRKKVLAGGGKIFGTSVQAGSMPATPFVRPAFEANKDKALSIFGREMWKNLVRTAKRFEKQAKAGKLSSSGRRALGL